MSKEHLKVLFLPKWYPNRFDRLDGVFIVDHAIAASKYHQIFVLFIHSAAELDERVKISIDDTKGFIEITVYFKYQKIGIHVLDQLISGVKYLMNQFRAYRMIRKKYGQPDVVHVHVLLRSSLLAMWLKIRRGIPYIVTEHWSGYDPKSGVKIGKLRQIIIAFILQHAAAITTVSDHLKKQMQQISNRTLYTVISNAIDDQLFKPMIKTVSEKKKIIHVSTLDDYPKNVGRILHVISRMYQKQDNFELHLIGKGAEMKKQQALAEKLQILGKAVFFHGYLPKDEVAVHIAQSDFMILFSHYETQSCVLLESFMCGVPVIAPRIGGISEIVEPYNGVLVPHLNEEQFYQAILSFLRDEYVFDSLEIRDKAFKYSYQEVGEAFSKLYKQVVSGTL